MINTINHTVPYKQFIFQGLLVENTYFVLGDRDIVSLVLIVLPQFSFWQFMHRFLIDVSGAFKKSISTKKLLRIVLFILCKAIRESSKTCL